MFYLTLIVYCLIFYLMAGFAINIAYHRCLSHRSFKMWKPLEYFCVILGLPAGTPIQWAGNHRFHHAHTDGENDPHSPIKDGFWHSHVGWYIGTKNPLICFIYSIAGPMRTLFDGWNRPRTNQQYNHLAKDVSADSFYNFISKPIPFMLACWFHTAFLFGLSYLIWGTIGLIVQWFLLVLIYNLGDAIDSIAHLSGERPYKTDHFARNNKWLGYLTLGEGWHANHHIFPFSAKHGLLENQFDGIWEIIRFLSKLSLISEIKLPTNEQISLKLKQK